jgi:hypothetical protein
VIRWLTSKQRNLEEVNGMTEIERLKKSLSNVTYMSEVEKAEYIKGATILLDLGWPPNFDYPMIQRAIAGLVPKYEGWPTFFAYKVQWAKEDNAAALKRALAIEAAAKLSRARNDDSM